MASKTTSSIYNDSDKKTSWGTWTKYFSCPISTINSALNNTSNVPANARITSVVANVTAWYEVSGSANVYFSFGIGGNGSISSTLLSKNQIGSQAYTNSETQSKALPIGKNTSPFSISTASGDYLTVCIETENRLPKTFEVESITLTIEYETPYTITVSKGTGCASVSGGGSYFAGTTITISATGSTGYKWGSWNDGNTTQTNRSITVNGNATYTANFTPITYYVAYDANGGSGTMAADSVKYGNNYTIKNCSFTAPNITHTYNANGGSCSKSKDTIAKKFSIWKDDYSGAEYSQGQVVKNLHSTDNTTSNLLAIWVNPTITLPTATRDGYEFLGWVYNGTTYAAGAQLTPTTGATFTASWKQLKITEVYNGATQTLVYVGSNEIGEIYVGNTKVYG